MPVRENELGQPIGPPLPGWAKRPLPSGRTLVGRTCRLERLDPSRTEGLHEALAEDTKGRLWTYLRVGPFREVDEFRALLKQYAAAADPFFYTIFGEGDQPLGLASLMRIDPQNGTLEVGNITYAPRLQRTTAATEAMYLLMKHVFEDLGYRRYEWKCDALNAASRSAALRLGFTYEGTFRHAVVYKGRSRDTAWFSVIDSEWPEQKAAFEAWLAPSNFDEAGRQRRSLSELRATGRGP